MTCAKAFPYREGVPFAPGKNDASEGGWIHPRSEAPACGVLVYEIRGHLEYSGALKDDYSRLFVVTSGHLSWGYAGRLNMLGPDTMAHAAAGLPDRHEIQSPDAVFGDVSAYRPELLPAALQSQLAALGLVTVDLGWAVVNQARGVRGLLQEMLFEQESGQEGWEILLQSRLMDLAVRMLRLTRRRGRKDVPGFEPGSESTDRVARYVLHLKSHYLGQETIADAARSVALSPRQFGELFRRVTGQSWRQYVHGLRLKHAAELLAETDRPVSVVAFESGFEDLSNFHHCFKTVHGCSPLAYREQRRVHLPAGVSSPAETARADKPLTGFRFRGMKGWSWAPEQYLEEIPTLGALKMNFLMTCYRSVAVSHPGDPWCNKWWEPLPAARREAFEAIIRACQENDIAFCLALHPQLASPRPLNPANDRDIEAFTKHYLWAQCRNVKWFSICLDDTRGLEEPTVGGAVHARLVNRVFDRLRAEDSGAQMILCPTACWGDGTNPEHNAYLSAIARELHPEAYVFWNGDAIVTPRVTRVAAESYRRAVQHRMFLWDNYPVNDANPTLHLGALSGRDAGLCEVIDGYLSNSMCAQNQINRIPLATCADYAYNPKTYAPSRSITQAIVRLGATPAQQQVLKDLVEAYPGFIVAGGGTGTNPVRARFAGLMEAEPAAAARGFLRKVEDMLQRLNDAFPSRFSATRRTVLADIQWMKSQVGGARAAGASKPPGMH